MCAIYFYGNTIRGNSVRVWNFICIDFQGERSYYHILGCLQMPQNSLEVFISPANFLISLTFLHVYSPGHESHQITPEVLTFHFLFSMFLTTTAGAFQVLIANVKRTERHDILDI